MNVLLSYKKPKGACGAKPTVVYRILEMEYNEEYNNWTIKKFWPPFDDINNPPVLYPAWETTYTEMGLSGDRGFLSDLLRNGVVGHGYSLVNIE